MSWRFLTAEYDVIRMPWQEAISGMSFSCKKIVNKSCCFLNNPISYVVQSSTKSGDLFNMVQEGKVARHSFINRPLVPPTGKRRRGGNLWRDEGSVKKNITHEQSPCCWWKSRFHVGRPLGKEATRCETPSPTGAWLSPGRQSRLDPGRHTCKQTKKHLI